MEARFVCLLGVCVCVCVCARARALARGIQYYAYTFKKKVLSIHVFDRVKRYVLNRVAVKYRLTEMTAIIMIVITIICTRVLLCFTLVRFRHGVSRTQKFLSSSVENPEL